jgi:GT2 family glycosyltransferase
MNSLISPGFSDRKQNNRTPEPAVLSIIIVSWNVRELLEDCLRSLYDGGIDRWAEIILVDNASTDDTVEMVQHRFPHVHLIQSPANLGFSRANNLAYTRSRGKYILLLNPDTVVPPGSIEKLVDYLDTHPDYGATAPKQVGRHGQTQFEAAVALPTIWNVLCDWATLSRVFSRSQFFAGRKLGNWNHEDSRDVPAVAGSAMLLRREALDEVGLLDENMFMIEDMDLCFRLRKSSWKTFYLASACITHYGGESLKRDNNPELQLQIAFHSFWIYLRKNKGPMYALALTAVMFCWSLGAIPVALVCWPVLSSRGSNVSGRKWLRYAIGVLRWTIADKMRFRHPLATPLAA